MRIGFELETVCMTTPNNGVGDYHDGIPVEELGSIGGRDIQSQSDSSISMSEDEYGIEFVSPTFAFNSDNIKKMFKTCDDIHDIFGARVNRSCGTHISISLPPLDHVTYRLLYFNAKMFQQGMFASTGSINRQEGRYANPIQQLPYTGESGIDEGRYSNQDRTSWLNMYHVDKTRKVTSRNERCEMRLFSGTLDGRKLVAWSQLATCFIAWATDIDGVEPTLPNKKPAGMGEGLYNLNCLLESLGWIGDDCNSNWVDNDMMTEKEGVALLQELARKYDAKMFDERQGYLL